MGNISNYAEKVKKAAATLNCISTLNTQLSELLDRAIIEIDELNEIPNAPEDTIASMREMFQPCKESMDRHKELCDMAAPIYIQSAINFRYLYKNIEPIVMMDRLRDIAELNGGDSGEKHKSDNDKKDI